MDCETTFIVFCCILAVCILINSIFTASHVIIIATLTFHKRPLLPDASIDDLKSVSNTPLLFQKRSKSAPAHGQVVTNQLHVDSLVLKASDRLAVEAIYGTDGLEVEVSQVREIHSSPIRRGKVAEKANIFENPQATTPTRTVKKTEYEKRRVNELSDRFKSDSHIPKGLQLKQPKVEDTPPNTPEDRPKSPPPKKKKTKFVKDPPSVFKLRQQRDDFLDPEFVQIMEQTNKRLAEYTLAGVVSDDVQIFANQHLTQTNIKRSQLEFNKTAFLSQTKDTHTRKLSDHKNMMLMAQSVSDDFDFDIAEKKATSMQSVASRQTEITALSQDFNKK